MFYVRLYDIYTYISVIVDKISILYFVFVSSSQYVAEKSFYAEDVILDLVLLKGSLFTADSTKVVQQKCKSVRDNADWHYG